jgi:hypothetical protein
MSRRLFSIALLILVGAAVLVAAGFSRMGSRGAVIAVGDPIRVQFQEGPATARVYAGWIKDVRPAWGYLILTVGKGIEARDVRFDISEARIVGPLGNEWKGKDLHLGDRVLVEQTADGSLVKQVSVLDN